jgi:hypothetical protein
MGGGAGMIPEALEVDAGEASSEGVGGAVGASCGIFGICLTDTIKGGLFA